MAKKTARCCSSTSPKNELDRRSAQGDSPFCALCFSCSGFLTAAALEFAHETGEGFDGFEGDGVVERHAHAADGAVAGSANQSGRGGVGGELLSDGVVGRRHPGHYS